MIGDDPGQADSRQNRPHNVATHIRQPKIAALIAISEPVVLDAEQMQQRGVQVVDFDDVLDGVVAQVVGRAVADAALDAAAAQPARKSPSCGGRARRAWAIGVRPNSPVQTISVSSSIPRFFRSVTSAAHG